MFKILVSVVLSCDIKGCQYEQVHEQPPATDSKKLNPVGIARNNKWYVATHAGSDFYVCPHCVEKAEFARKSYAKLANRSVNKLRTVFILKKDQSYISYNQVLNEAGKYTAQKDKVVNTDTGIFYFANRQ